MCIILRIKIFNPSPTKNVFKFPDLFSSSFRLQKKIFNIMSYSNTLQKLRRKRNSYNPTTQKVPGNIFSV